MPAFSPERQHQRYPVQLLAVAVDTTPRLDHVHDLSKAGARLSSRSAPPVGTPYTFLLVIPGSQARSLVVKLPARVVWSSSFDFGVSFERRDVQVDTYLDQLAGSPA
jgi:hypothetical protein